MTRRRTVLLDSSVYDPEAWIPWFAERQNPPPQSSIVPLGQLLAPQSPRRIKNLSADDPRKFRYAKVGQQDPYAFPTLGPGSIVRVNELRTADCLRSTGEGISENVFLVKYGSRFHCGHLTWPGRERVLLCSAAFPFAQMELVRGRNVRILGVVDAEIRRLSSGAETKTSIDPLHTAENDTARSCSKPGETIEYRLRRKVDPHHRRVRSRRVSGYQCATRPVAHRHFLKFLKVHAHLNRR